MLVDRITPPTARALRACLVAICLSCSCYQALESSQRVPTDPLTHADDYADEYADDEPSASRLLWSYFGV